MQQILDLHIHSKYSRACSPKLDLEHIDLFCKIKGIDIVATGDFTHPKWFKEIQNKLVEIDSTGLYELKEKLKIKNSSYINLTQKTTKFILGTELALVYTKKEKYRRVHIVVLAPHKKAVQELNEYLNKKYNIYSDGRPILGMSAEKLCEICFKIDKNFIIIPAHIWTPWYAIFGSKSGFDSLEECFGEWTPKIKAVETGLSSDPEMNWMLSSLDNITLLSNSDAHSLPNLGREANIFDLKKVTYKEIKQVIESGDRSRFIKTIEFYPEEGMYHFDGHRDCDISYSPQETKKKKGICPKCKKPLIIGVMNRVYELADRKLGFKPNDFVPFIKLIELDKIIAESLSIKSRASKKVQQIYQNMINQLGSELFVLMQAKEVDLKNIAGKNIAKKIIKMRKGEVDIKPGYDGKYGEIKIGGKK